MLPFPTGPEGAAPPTSIVLQPAKSGDLTSRDLAGYPGSFGGGGGGGGGGGRSGSSFSGELAGRDRVDQLHYASKPVSSGIYQSLGRRGRRGHKHGSLSSSDNNSDTTTYAESELRCKMEQLQSGECPPPPSPDWRERGLLTDRGYRSRSNR